MSLENGENKGGTQVWQLPDGTIVLPVVQVDSNGNATAGLADTPEFYEDTNFVTAESPVIIPLNTDLGRNATDGTVINDGPGSFTVAPSVDGVTFGDAITLYDNEFWNFAPLSVHSLRIIWVADSAYRITAV